jgi:hypothetical protein
VILCVKQPSLSYDVFTYCLRVLKTPKNAARITRAHDLWGCSPDAYVLYIRADSLYTAEDRCLEQTMYSGFTDIREIDTDVLVLMRRL